MSVYFCNGCHEYKDSDLEGLHDDCEIGYICDDCEGLTHEQFYIERMNHLARLMKAEI